MKQGNGGTVPLFLQYVCSSGDDFILHLSIQLDKVCTIAGDAYHQFTVVGRMCFCVLKGIAIHYIELDMFAAMGQVNPDHVGKLFHISCRLKR